MLSEVERENLAVVRRGLAALASGDIPEFARCIHADAVWHLAPAGTLKDALPEVSTIVPEM